MSGLTPLVDVEEPLREADLGELEGDLAPPDSRPPVLEHRVPEGIDPDVGENRQTNCRGKPQRGRKLVRAERSGNLTKIHVL